MRGGPTTADRFRAETLKAVEVVEQAFGPTRRDVVAGDIAYKGGRDVMTGTDVAVEDAVRKLLTEALGLTVVGEERGGEAPLDGSAYWLVDPICGTRNFASGIPLYCVNLALVEGDRVTVAVVGDPSTGEINVAERGRGAWALRHGRRRPLAVSDESRTIVVEDSASKGTMRERAAELTARAIRADRWHFRSLGTTLALPYVAAGRVSAYALFWTSSVHVGAGSLLATEAGATLTDLNGRKWALNSNSLLVSANDSLHADLLDLARATAPRPT
jgi:myo-inositol-1(or 4)-monophosphatase